MKNPFEHIKIENYFIYAGSSMYPTFRQGDVLQIVPYNRTSPRIGDVIVFEPPWQVSFVVHRIIKLKGGKMVTRGDNSSVIDPCLLSSNHAKGYVSAVLRGKQRKKVLRGRCGFFMVFLRRVILPFRKRLARLLISVSFRSRQYHCFRRMIPRNIKPKVAVFTIKGEFCLRMLFRGRVIGSFDMPRRQWCIRNPYELLISEDVEKG